MPIWQVIQMPWHSANGNKRKIYGTYKTEKAALRVCEKYPDAIVLMINVNEAGKTPKQFVTDGFLNRIETLSSSATETDVTAVMKRFIEEVEDGTRTRSEDSSED